MMLLSKVSTSLGPRIKGPKSKAGTREVPILEDTLFHDLGVYLRNHPHRSDLEASLWPGKVSGHARISFDWAFNPKGFYRNDFKPACERAGLGDLVFHELRHTFATLALESGTLTMYELSRAMGHETEAMTNKVYAHLRKRDYSVHRAAFSAHVAAASAPPKAVAAWRR